MLSLANLDAAAVRGLGFGNLGILARDQFLVSPKKKKKKTPKPLAHV